MNIRTRILIIVAVIAGLIGVGAISAPYVLALDTDPKITVVAPATVQAGTPITFDVTVDQAGFTPGNPRITYRRCTTCGTINVANYTVIPVSFDGTVWHFTYTPDASQIGRSEVFQVEVALSASYNPRKVYGSAGFKVTA